MKKFYLLVLSVLISLSASAEYQRGYYDRMDGKKKEALKAAVKECISNHRQLDYTDLPTSWYYTDVYPDLYNGNKRWWEMYSNEVYLIYNNQSALQSFRNNKMQREHSVPKSWWGGADVPTPAYSDIFNLYPSDGPANQAKSNYPLGPVGNASFNNGVTKVGTAASGYGGNGGKVFEPADMYKGDFARAYFYVFTLYDNLNWTSNSMASKNSWPTLKPWAYEMLLQWARQDPVSQKEIERNDAAEKRQGNRNPFIDFPELAEYIWGTRTSETFYISQQGGDPTPPITGDPELISPVDGEALDLGQVAVGGVISAPLLVDGKNLTSALSLRIIGDNKTMFSTEGSSISAASINAEGGFKLNIFYKPTEQGKHTARLLLYDGGFPDSKQFVVNLSGEAFPVPELQRLTAYDPTGLSSTSYTASWSASAQTADYYVFTRTRYLESGAVTTTQQTPYTEYTVTDRDENVAESYYVQSSRLGYLSPKSNTVMVAAGGSGINSAEASLPLSVGLVEGGFIVLTDDVVKNLTVYDMQGRCVYMLSEASYGDFVSLPKGIYLVTSETASRPIKLMIQ